MTISLIILQILGIIFHVWVYINIILEVLFIYSNIHITHKIVRSFRIFEFRETKSTLIWVYLITVSVLVSLLTRIAFNIMSLAGKDDYPVKDMDLNGADKLIHLGIISAIELAPCVIWVTYIAYTRGEIERTLSVKSTDIYGGQRVDICATNSGTLTGTRTSGGVMSLLLGEDRESS